MGRPKDLGLTQGGGNDLQMPEAAKILKDWKCLGRGRGRLEQSGGAEDL